MKWQEIIGIGIQPDPPVKELVPGLVAALLFYLLAFLISYTAFRVSRFILPSGLHSITTDFLKTMLICTYPYGHGQIKQMYGKIGYFFTAVPLSFLTVSAFPDGHGSPLNIFLEYVKGRVSTLYLVFRIAVQTFGAFTSYSLAKFVWSLRIHSFHTKQLTTMSACASDLKVSLQVGFALECLCVIYDTWLGYQKLSRFPTVDSVLKTANGAIMVCLGVHLTGMYLHPAMASGMSFFCQGSSAFEHFAVYWISAFFGCYIGHLIHVKLTSNIFRSRKKLEEINDHGDELDETKKKLN